MDEAAKAEQAPKTEETPKAEETPKRKRRLFLWLGAGFLCLFVLVVLGVILYLASPLPADQISRLVTSYLHQNFVVKEAKLSGRTLVLKGVRLENPAGFPKGNLAEADSVAVAPQWRSILRGGQRYRLIALRGIRINLEKNGKGVWNFAQLQQLLAKRKPSKAETYVKELLVRDGAVKVEGQGVQGIALQVYNFSTKGSLDSSLNLAFEDSAHNRFTVKGKARGGSDAAVDVAISAPAMSLRNVASLLKLRNPAPFQGSTGSLAVNATLKKGDLAATGDFSFSGVNVPTAQKNYPIEGTLHFAADYLASADTAHLQECTLTVNDMMELHAQGNARNLKGDRDYALYLSMKEMDLGTLNVLVSEEKRKNLFFGGRLRCDSLHILGNRNGLKSAVGTLELRDGAVSREGRALVDGLNGTIGLFRKDANILAKGRFSLPGQHDNALLANLDMPFVVTLSPNFHPVSAQVPALAARVMGIPLTGKLAYDATLENLDAAIRIPTVNLSSSAVNAQLKRYDVQTTSGTAAVTFDVAGKSPKDMTGTAHVQLAEVRGFRGKEPFTIKKGSVNGNFRHKDEHLQAQGDALLTALTLNGKGGDARFGFRILDKMVHLDALQAVIAGMQLSAAHIATPIPAKEVVAGNVRYPLNIDLEGVGVKGGQVEVADLSGRVRGSFNSEASARWLDGTADLSASAVKWRGKKVGATALHAAFARPGGRAELNGQLLGGKLTGTVAYDPFAKEPSAAYDLSLKGAALAAAADLAAKAGGLRPSSGAVDVQMKGGYTRRGGISCGFVSRGSGIALTGSGGKNLVSGGRLLVNGAFTGGNLALKEAVLDAGQGVSLRAKGDVARALSAKPEGTLSFSMTETDINALVDAFVNLLPRFLQEATLEGRIAADGRINFREGSKLLEGAVTVKKARMEVPSQKLVVADLDGRLPVSLDLAGKAGARPQEPMDFSRENYPRLLERLRKGAGNGQVISIGKLAFGAVETGRVTMNVSALNGLTQILSLRTSLFQGDIIGRGYVRMGEKVGYRGDLLVNNLSLKTLCSAFPGIQGYISGRVDGVASISGEGKGVNAVTGFTNFWAREGGGEKMVVSKEFLQRLAKQKLSGFFFRTDRPYDKAEIKALLQEGDLTFETLVIQHTNFFRVRDLSVNIAPGANRIAIDHLLDSIKEAAVRGKPTTGAKPAEAPATPQFKWGE